MPFLLGALSEFEYHAQRPIVGYAAIGPFGVVALGGKRGLNHVGRAHDLPMVCRKVVLGHQL